MSPHPLPQHHESPKRGDNKAAIRRAAGGNFDGNLTVMAGRIWFAHWSVPGRNGYTRVVDARTGKVRKMTMAERRRPGDRWGDAGIRRWRRPNGERILSFDEGIRYAVRHGAVCIGELKSPVFGTDPSYARRAVAICKKHDHPTYFKTLSKMRNAEGKVRLFRVAGASVALIYGGSIRGRTRRLAATRRVAKNWAVQPSATW